MLIEFRVGNFRSFADPQTFSLVASSDTRHPDNCIPFGKLQLLESAGIDRNFGLDHYEPPDTHGAIGPRHFVEFVNDAFAIYDKSGNLAAPATNEDTFWVGAFNAAGTPFDPTEADLTDADLTGAMLKMADLYAAELTGATLAGAIYDSYTRWPIGFDPARHGAMKER